MDWWALCVIGSGVLFLAFLVWAWRNRNAPASDAPKDVM